MIAMRLLFATILLLACSIPIAAATSGECWYLAKGNDDESRKPDCLREPTGKRQLEIKADACVTRQVARSLSYDDDGLAFVRGNSGFFYVNRNRTARATVSFDNGPDYFSDGLARTVRNGKTGYFDKTLKIVIEPQFDFGFPFDHGVAIVCNGCVGKRDGEHEIMTGGKWGAIDRTGMLVQPIEYGADELRQRLDH